MRGGSLKTGPGNDSTGRQESLPTLCNQQRSNLGNRDISAELLLCQAAEDECGQTGAASVSIIGINNHTYSRLPMGRSLH